MQLARRVLQLERANTSLRKEVERENLKTKQLAEEVSIGDHHLSPLWLILALIDVMLSSIISFMPVAPKPPDYFGDIYLKFDISA